jgi:hypothetical protein
MCSKQDFLGEDTKVTTIAGLFGKKVTYNDQGSNPSEDK